MRIYTRVLLFCLFSYSLLAYAQQIPNGDFESWNSNGTPTGWFTSDVPGFVMTVTKDSNGYSGASVKGSVMQQDIGGTIFINAPLLFSGSDGKGIPVNTRPGSFQGYYKFQSVSNDTLYVYCLFKKNGVGMGATLFTMKLQPTNNWTFFSEDTYWINGDVPDTAMISAYIGNSSDTLHVGSTFELDNLAFGSATAIDNENTNSPFKFELSQNYPNPFNPSTVIRYSLATESHVTVTVYNMLGQEVSQLVNKVESEGGHEVNFNALELASGIYIYRISAFAADGKSSFVQTKKMMLVK